MFLAGDMTELDDAFAVGRARKLLLRDFRAFLGLLKPLARNGVKRFGVDGGDCHVGTISKYRVGPFAGLALSLSR